MQETTQLQINRKSLQKSVKDWKSFCDKFQFVLGRFSSLHSMVYLLKTNTYECKYKTEADAVTSLMEKDFEESETDFAVN